ncbi:Apolipoprotein N-acyltransferase [Candidatus Liberibacter americanus str. Sao Paulo]|uniref:Apolipoprotein N-acyltransferase n=2 Tax=Candidatus Liberibacter americanus TaxID=309868 RepID=U6B6R1_9HYPH|nr:Apolipoprotein N-acyltransferase [Candidatus Liberibacter americanus str. Sao Paulo]
MLLAGIRRYFLAILAGFICSFAIPPLDLFFASFVSFTLLVWLLDGISSFSGRVYSISRIISSFLVGWSFGIGYFIAGLWWIKEVFMGNTVVFWPSLDVIILCVIIPAFFAIFYGIATSLSSILWSEGIGRIFIIAFSFGLCEWLRSWIIGGTAWNSIGYAAMPIPTMMQSVHFIGLFGINALSVFCFASPALFGTRQDMHLGMSISSILLVLHISYGMWKLEDTSEGSQTIVKKEPIIRIVKPKINLTYKESKENILEHYLSITSIPGASQDKEPTVIVWAGDTSFFSYLDSPQILKRVSSVLKKGQLLVFRPMRTAKEFSNGKNIFYKPIRVMDNKGKFLNDSDVKNIMSLNKYSAYRIADKLNFYYLNFLKNHSFYTHKEIYPLIFSSILFHIDIISNVYSINSIIYLIDDYWMTSSMGGYYQSLRYARIKAVETGLPLIISANNGISAFFDSKSNIIWSISIDSSESIDIYFQSTLRTNIHSEIRMRNFWIIELILLLLAIIAL